MRAISWVSWWLLIMPTKTLSSLQISLANPPLTLTKVLQLISRSLLDCVTPPGLKFLQAEELKTDFVTVLYIQQKGFELMKGFAKTFLSQLILLLTHILASKIEWAYCNHLRTIDRLNTYPYQRVDRLYFFC